MVIAKVGDDPIVDTQHLFVHTHVWARDARHDVHTALEHHVALRGRFTVVYTERYVVLAAFLTAEYLVGRDGVASDIVAGIDQFAHQHF